MDPGKHKPQTGSLLMTRTAGTKGLPHRVISSLTQALLSKLHCAGRSPDRTGTPSATEGREP